MKETEKILKQATESTPSIIQKFNVGDTHISCVDKPLVTAPRNYAFNRSPLLAVPLAKLPLGSIKPKGWLKHQLDLMVNGMTGKLSELSNYLKPDNGWFGGESEGWEEQPYWFRGFFDLATLTGDTRLLNESKRWIEAIFASQDQDGYFGAKYHKCVVGKNEQKVCDLWPHMVMLDAVISHYEYSSDSRVIPFMTRFFNFCRNLPEELFIPIIPGKQSVQRARAGDMLPHLYWLYNHTGEKELLALATRFYQHIEPPANEWLAGHVVHFTQRFRYSGNYYIQSGFPGHLSATEYWYRQHLATWGQQPRGIFGADERVRPGCTDPRQGFETCGMVEFNKSFYILGRITGQTLYADRCEDITLNHFSASQTPDLKALHYLTASNQPQLDASENHEYFNKGKQICYSPNIYRCCQHNVAMGWPYYAENLWQATADNGLAAWLYAACEITAAVGKEGAEVTIGEETEYPFDGKVRMTIKSRQKVRFPLYFRVPGWCEKLHITINKEKANAVSQPGKYVRIERHWIDGDTVVLQLEMNPTLTLWPRTGSVTVNRGPLSYSVKIGEKWQRCGGTDQWPEWEVFPTTPWNYGLLVKDYEDTSWLQVVQKDKVADQPWTVEGAPVEIKATGKKIPWWGLENETVAELQPSPIKTDEPEEAITLIPMGCARLRMSCLPVVEG